MSSSAVRREEGGGRPGNHDVVSPVSGEVIDRVFLADREDLDRAINRLATSSTPLPKTVVFEFLGRLRAGLVAERQILEDRTILETGFIARDARDIVEGAIEFLGDFEVYVRNRPAHDLVIRHSYSGGIHRDMRLVDRPVRCVAAIVPQNASLTLGIIIIASALYAGSRVLLRPSLQCASTGAILDEIIARSGCPPGYIEVANCLASDMLEACYGSRQVDLIHYIGSNQYALPRILERVRGRTGMSSRWSG